MKTKKQKENHYLDLRNSLNESLYIYMDQIKDFAADNNLKIKEIYDQDRRYDSLFLNAFSCSQVKGHFLLRDLSGIGNLSSKSIERYVIALCENGVIVQMAMEDKRVSAYKFTINKSLEKIFLERQLLEINAITQITEAEYVTLKRGIKSRLAKLTETDFCSGIKKTVNCNGKKTLKTVT